MTHTPVYAIGDIHGDLVQLKSILKRIDDDVAKHAYTDHTIVFIGDLVDRQPDSKGVIDLVMAGLSAGKPWVVLKGNHDRLFQWFFETPHRADPNLRSDYSWLYHRMGGQETLQSYGIKTEEPIDVDQLHKDALEILPQAHYDFLTTQTLSYQTDDCIFVHAGINQENPLDAQDEDDLLWIRKGFLEIETPFEKLVIHGHTIVPEVTHYGNRVNIDTGAAWGDTLSAVVVLGTDIFELTPEGRTPVVPK